MNLLLVEDNESIAAGLKYFFASNGYNLRVAETLQKACDIIKQEKIALIILDIALPDGSGLTFYEEEIKDKNIPTLFLTAIDDEESVVKGLDIGAEDYITKPFSSKELLVRCQKILARCQKRKIITVQDITFDMDKMIVYKDNTPIELTSLELKILALLLQNLNKVVRRGAIIDLIWQETGNDVDDHTITVYLKRIREKLDTNIIITIKGIGYRIDE